MTVINCQKQIIYGVIFIVSCFINLVYFDKDKLWFANYPTLHATWFSFCTFSHKINLSMLLLFQSAWVEWLYFSFFLSVFYFFYDFLLLDPNRVVVVFDLGSSTIVISLVDHDMLLLLSDDAVRTVSLWQSVHVIDLCVCVWEWFRNMRSKYCKMWWQIKVLLPQLNLCSTIAIVAVIVVYYLWIASYLSLSYSFALWSRRNWRVLNWNWSLRAAGYFRL